MSNGSATAIGYSIEARSIDRPCQLLGQLIGERWVEILTRENEGGVPNPLFSRLAQEQGLLAYPTAMSLMSYAAASKGYASCVEFRLVKKVLKYSYTLERAGVGEAINYFEHEGAAKFTPEPKETV